MRQGTGDFLLRPTVKLLVRKGGEPFQPAATATTSATPEATGISQPTASPTLTATPEATGDFFLYIEEPESPEVVTTESSITIIGRTRVDATVSVNDIFVDVDEDGRFRVTLDLDEAPNVIEVVASLSTGETLDQVLIVIYSP